MTGISAACREPSHPWGATNTRTHSTRSRPIEYGAAFLRISMSGASESTEVAAIVLGGDTILPMPPPMVLAASRMDGSRPAPAAAVDWRFAKSAPRSRERPCRSSPGSGRGTRRQHPWSPGRHRWRSGPEKFADEGQRHDGGDGRPPCAASRWCAADREHLTHGGLKHCLRGVRAVHDGDDDAG